MHDLIEKMALAIAKTLELKEIPEIGGYTLPEKPQTVDLMDVARAAFNAISASGSYVVVPVEPTEEMVAAGLKAAKQEALAFHQSRVCDGYKAMLAARPRE